MNNSKTIGNIGEAVVLAEFVKRNIPIYIPFGENDRCDFIAEFNGKLNRIQVKTSKSIQNGTIVWNIRSITGTKGRYTVRHYNEDEIDYFALYNIETGLALLVPLTSIKSRAAVSFTYPFKICNKVKQNNWQDYTFDKIINA